MQTAFYAPYNLRRLPRFLVRFISQPPVSHKPPSSPAPRAPSTQALRGSRMTLASPDVQTPFVLTESRAFTELYDHEIPPPTSSILTVKEEEKKILGFREFFFYSPSWRGSGSGMWVWCCFFSSSKLLYHIRVMGLAFGSVSFISRPILSFSFSFSFFRFQRRLKRRG